MITHYEVILTVLGILVGWLSALVLGVWRMRGWMDRRTQSERELTRALRELTRSQEMMHAANQTRFERIENRLGWGYGPPDRARAQ